MIAVATMCELGAVARGASGAIEEGIALAFLGGLGLWMHGYRRGSMKEG